MNLWILTNGVNSNPEDVKAWTDKGEDYLEENTQDDVKRYEYESWLPLRRLTQETHVDDLEFICKEASRKNKEIILVGHSNAGDLYQRLVKRKNLKFKFLHLIAAANERDFNKNGFNQALLDGRIEKIFCYCSKNDEALKRAKMTWSFLNLIGLGFGWLGLDGPLNVDEGVKDRVVVIWKNYKHSGWLNKDNFKETFDTLISNK